MDFAQRDPAVLTGRDWAGAERRVIEAETQRLFATRSFEARHRVMTISGHPYRLKTVTVTGITSPLYGKDGQLVIVRDDNPHLMITVGQTRERPRGSPILPDPKQQALARSIIDLLNENEAGEESSASTSRDALLAEGVAMLRRMGYDAADAATVLRPGDMSRLLRIELAGAAALNPEGRQAAEVLIAEIDAASAPDKSSREHWD